MSADLWLPALGGPAGPAPDIVCFPHAGGAASFFRPWAADAAARGLRLWCAQYPGREDRLDEPPRTDIAALADPLAAAAAGLGEHGLVLFGHSMGALVAYEVARRLDARIPLTLVVSGRRPPAVPPERIRHGLGDDALVAELAALGGPTLLLSRPDTRAIFLPGIRADLRAAETYQHAPGPLLRAPITAVVGDADGEAGPDLARGWAAHTRGAFALSVQPGDHFYLTPRRRAVLDLLLAGARTAAPALCHPVVERD
ncbi:MAG TPA: alpha/beta fold hydrolase [Pilimelia sp.]|nr:alpha/beta fold hydrolase [Pilimelia sp.]